MIRPRLVFPFIFVLFFGFVVVARADDFDASSKIAVAAVTDVSPIPAGGSGTIAIQVDVQPGWHIQSAVPHATYLIPTAVKTPAIPGVTFGAPRYPAHRELPDPDPKADPPTIAAYEDHIVLLLPFTLAADVKPGPMTIKAKIHSQACEATQCIAPADTAFEVTFTVGAVGSAAKAQNRQIFEDAGKQTFLVPATRPAATVPGTKPATEPTPPAAAVDHTKAGKEIVLLSDDAQIALIKDRKYKPYNEEHLSLGLIILSALLGGAILNVMPCVLPVIPLKVLGLVQQAHGDRRLVILHGLTFSAGIITLFIFLAVVLKVLGLFYGQQFQSAWFLIAMAFIVLAFALSLLGVWTIQTPQAVYKIDKPHSGYAGSFSSGLLATLLATPCSAPYLGPVLAWALLQPTWITALTLGLVGVGMSLPYLVLAAFPNLLKRMPKAGRWTELLKQGLGIAMIGVALYLILLLPNSLYWPYVLYGAVALGIVCWAWGQIPTGAMEPSRVWTIRGIAVTLGIAAGVGIFFWGQYEVRASTPAPPPGVPTVFLPDEPSLTWLPFNVAILDEALKSGRPVVVDWTASWCQNCHFLESTVLSTSTAHEAFLKSHAVLLRADESVENPPTTALKEALGRKAIPVLAIFSPEHPRTPVVLGDFYGADTLAKTLVK